MEGEWDLETWAALIALILTGIGIFIALVFNFFATKQNSRTQLYQILKDLEDKFHKIELDFPIGTKYDFRNYFMSLINFATFMANIEKQKIIDKELLLTNYRYNFEIGLWIYNHIIDTDFQEQFEYFKKFCKENKISESSPKKERLPEDMTIFKKYSKEKEPEKTKTT